MREIRVYIEGGGNGKDTKASFRRGFGEFLSPLRQLARAQRARWNLVACGSRNAAMEAFRWALRAHPAAFNLLLVDSEGPLAITPWEHLRRRDGWEPPGVPDEQCHLMVQMMEAWLIADPAALAGFYGDGFRAGALPAQRDVEKIAGRDIETALDRATRDCRKGRYRKIPHGAELLRALDPAEVRQRAPFCDRLFRVLEERLSA